MCGLAGRFAVHGLPPAPEWQPRADARLAHRGPDGAGRFADDRCELVHRRLALLDLSDTGRQPMANEDGSVLVVFNGEIYNYRELRAELRRRGHEFRSSTDTEVLVHLYEEAGDAMVARLEGMFAFAIYDRPRRRLLLARDRWGIKPLFYTEIDGQWLFGSEIKALTAYDGFRPTLDAQACYDFLSLGYVPEPATGFAGVHALRPGCHLAVSAEGARCTAYHRTTARPDGSLGLTESAEALAAALPAAVARQLVADVPVAALLSGGIDSSLVVAAQRRVGAAATTFNVRFPDRVHDETPAALAAAAHCDTPHRTVDLRDGALTADALLDLMRHFDQPFADTSFIPMYWIARAMREHGVKCALSGDGGDEVFGGYSAFWRTERLARLMDWPAWLRRAAGTAGRWLTPHTRDRGRQITKAVALAEAGRFDPALLLAGLAAYVHEEEKRELAPRGPSAAHARGLAGVHRHFNGAVNRHGDLEDLSRRLTESLFAVSLPSDMLRKVDMMSMRAGLEVRVPLLDERVVALGLRLPHRLKTNGRTGKLVPRALARRWLPRRVAARAKRGFDMPLDVMVPPAFHDAAADYLLGPHARTRAFLDRERVAGWLSAFRGAGVSGGSPRRPGWSRGGLSTRVCMLLSLEVWLREYGLTW